MKGKKNHLDLWFLILSALLVLIMLLDSAFLLSTGINRSMKGNESISTEVVSLEDGPDEIVSAKREEESPEEERVDDQILEEQSTIELLRSTIVPENDPIKLAKKYTRISDVPVHLQESPVLYQEGDSRKFWVLDVDINEYRNINAKLAVESPHVYFWVEDGVKFNHEDAEDLINYFERYIYPRNREILVRE